MKTAETWCDELDDLTDEGVIDFVGKPEIQLIQADALRWALEQVVPDGNPENIRAKIRAKLNELERHDN
jgi:FixJ family two-component response regulator